MPSSGTPVTYRGVLAALQGDDARSMALGLFRGAGCTADDFGHRTAARWAMAEALTRTEDSLETRGPGTRRERDVIRAIRRRLEAEVWP